MKNYKASRFIFIAALCLPGTSCMAHDFWSSTSLIELTQGSELSNKIRSYQGGGYESAFGNWISFKKWYSSSWVDSRITFMTQISPELGFIWGMSTGEHGEKYAINPSLKLGVVYLHLLDRRSSVSFRGSSIIGGNIKERSCTADYGEIGGVQEVNCRLAASTLAPAETLKYLLNEKPMNRNYFFVEYKSNF